jgi:hypothetical protein
MRSVACTDPTTRIGRRRKDRPPVTVIGTTVDVDGQRWAVHERRPTTHGFTVELGWLDGNVPGPGVRSGRARVIPTPDLADYLRQTPFRTVNLPLSPATVSHLRVALGTDKRSQYRQRWQAREADIDYLSVREFAQQHGVSLAATYTHFTASDDRRGRRNRPAGWWRHPEVAVQLLSLPCSEAAQRFGIQPATVGCYRRKLRQAEG